MSDASPGRSDDDIAEQAVDDVGDFLDPDDDGRPAGADMPADTDPVGDGDGAPDEGSPG